MTHSNSNVSSYLTKVAPKGPPYITNVPAEFSIGQWVNLNCTSKPSRPAARVTWFVNGVEVRVLTIVLID